MDPYVTGIVDAALASVSDPPEDDDAVSLLWLLLRRSEYAPDTAAFADYSEHIVRRHGEQATGYLLDREDVGHVIGRIAATIPVAPPRSGTLVNLLVAPHDGRAADPLATLLDQFEPPVSGEDENTVSSAMSALHGLAGRPRVQAAFKRWIEDVGEPGDLARAELAALRFPDTWWDDRPRSWRTLEDVGADAIEAIPLGWQDAPPIEALRTIIDRARVRAGGDSAVEVWVAEMLGPPLDRIGVNAQGLRAVAEAARRSAPNNVGAIGPLAEILAATATADTVPYVVDIARRNKIRNGSIASATQDRLVAALQPFTHRDDVRGLLAELSRDAR